MCQSPCVGGDSSGPTLELFNRLFKNHGIVSNKANSIINGVLYGLARVLVYILELTYFQRNVLPISVLHEAL